MQIVIVLVLSFFLAKRSYGQIKEVKFEDLARLQKVDKRPVVVFLHTSWCLYCGSMKNATLKNKEVVRLLHDKYYFIALDIEEKREISFRGNSFRYKPTGVHTGVHELAEQLGTINGSIAYPGICILNTDFEIIYQKDGFIPKKDFLETLERVLASSLN